MQRLKKRNVEIEKLNADLKKPTSQAIKDKKDRKMVSKQLATANAFFSLKLRTQVR
jgi:hypothetical protein